MSKVYNNCSKANIHENSQEYFQAEGEKLTLNMYKFQLMDVITGKWSWSMYYRQMSLGHKIGFIYI